MLTHAHAGRQGDHSNPSSKEPPMTQPAHAEALQQEAELDQIRLDLEPAADWLARATEARTAAADHCKGLAVKAYAAGMPELHIARELRVNRRTVRRWLGKPE